MRALRGQFLSSFCIAVMLLTTALMCGAQTVSQPVASGDHAAAVQQIQAVINDYKKAVDTLDLSIVRKIWSSGPEVTFIHPHGTEYGLDQIIEDVYGKAMGSYSKRELLPDNPQVHVYGDTAWSEFAWTFRAVQKSDGKNVTSKGRETQIYRKENGTWRIVHVHYSGVQVSGT